MEDTPIEEGDPINKDVEIAPALVAVDPNQKSVSVAVGSDLRVFSLQEKCAVSLVDESDRQFHKDSIRAIRYSRNGQLFVSAGDDKLVKIWWTETWRCFCNVVSEKRVSAVAISNDCLYVCFADKFGVIWVLDLDGIDGNQASVTKKASPLLSHYCSIITSLEVSPDGRFIISADRDFKIRVTVFPRKPLDGAHEIQSFCLGHTEFVSCLAFICNPEGPQGHLVSGSGDSTVRLWDIPSGLLLDTCEIGGKVDVLESNGKDDEFHSAITSLSTVSDSTLVAVAVQSFQGIILLSCDLSAHTLSIAKVVTIKGDTFIPTSLGTSSSYTTGLIWMVSGVSNLPGYNHPSFARVRVISGFAETELEPCVLEDSKVPGGEKLLQELQGSVSFEENVFMAAAEAVKTAMSNMMIKKQYTAEKRDFRKRTRNDRKLKQ